MDALVHAPGETTPSWIRSHLAWLLGIAILVGVMLASADSARPREFVGLLERARPLWLLLALVLQATTYLSQGETWRVALSGAGVRVSIARTYKLSLAKLFIDQALPSAGLSGSLVVARALERGGIARSVVLAAVLLDTLSYYVAYLCCLGAAVAVAALRGLAGPGLLGLSAVFAAFSVLVIACVLNVSRPVPAWLRRALDRIPHVRDAAAFMAAVDPRLMRKPRLVLRAMGWQLALLALDAATLWALLAAVGAAVSPADVFASFIVSTLLRRALGVVPGGLGTFEAASVYTLHQAGVPLAAALAATLLFRGLSFWLPMAPGLFYSRAARSAV
jgi:Mg2+-importing ATPase